MSEQALDLRRSIKIVRRHKILVGSFVALGVLAGAAFAVLRPPMVTGDALVGLPATTRDTATQVVVAGSNPVLAAALHNIQPATTLPALHNVIQVKSLTPNILSISAQSKTAAEAVNAANAVAKSYIAYVDNSNSAAGTVHAHLLSSATTAAKPSLATRGLLLGGLGALAGFLIGAIVALALNRGDRRLRERDEIANAIGVPVLASIPAHHPSDAGRWSKLLEEYEPGAVHAWQLRTALRYLGQPELMSPNGTNGSNGDGFSVTVLSLSSDRAALAVGPQLAAFGASLGIPTALVIGPQQEEEANVTAALRTACAAQPSLRRSGQLLVAVADRGDLAWRQPGAKLTVVVTVIGAKAPHAADTLPTAATVLGVSAGAATAAQLAGVAVSVAADGRQIDGILVADPDPADGTTGRVPQLARPAGRRTPTRLTGMTTEIRR
jgi:capsular polysaccharide biosynthesis protein